MHLGRAVGYALLALVDALVPGVMGAAITWLTLAGVPDLSVPQATLALAVGAAAFAVTLLASVVSHYRGGTPFAFTRLSRTVFNYWLWV